MEPLHVNISESLWDKITDHLNKETLPKYLQDELQQGCTKSLSQTRTLPLATFVRLGRCKKTDLGNITKYIFLKLPSPEKPPPNRELKERLTKLKAQQQNFEYKNMVSNVSSKISEGKSSSKVPVISGFNFALTAICATFITVYMLRPLIPDLALRCAVGVAVGTAILTIEIFLALRAIEKDDEIKMHAIKNSQIKLS